MPPTHHNYVRACRHHLVFGRFVAHSSAFAASTASTMAGRSWAPQVLPGGCHGASRFIAPNLRSGVTALRMSSGSEEEGKKGGLFGTGGFLGMFGGGGSTEERDAVVAQLTREEGWDMKMTIGSEPARALGGTGSVMSPPALSPGSMVHTCISATTNSYFVRYLLALPFQFIGVVMPCTAETLPDRL